MFQNTHSSFCKFPCDKWTTTSLHTRNGNLILPRDQDFRCNFTNLVGDLRCPLSRQKTFHCKIRDIRRLPDVWLRRRSIEHAFFDCPIAFPLCTSLVYTAEILVFLWLLGIMKVLVWIRRKKKIHGGESFSHQLPTLFFKHQLKVKIGLREKDYHSDFSESVE